MDLNEVDNGEQYMGFSIVTSYQSKMTVQKIKDILYSEGKELVDFIDQLFGYSKIMLKNVMPHLAAQRKRILCLYLVLKRLECEILRCGQTHIFNLIIPPLINSENVTREFILKHWPMDGAVLISQIETFVRRSQTSIMTDCDVESIYSWCGLIVDCFQRNYLPRFEFAEIEKALDQFVAEMMRLAQSVPSHYYFSHMWQKLESEIKTNTSFKRKDPSFDVSFREFLFTRLVFVKLYQENNSLSSYGGIFRDPYVKKSFEDVLASYTQVVTGNDEYSVMLEYLRNSLKNMEYGINLSWQKDLPLVSILNQQQNSYLMVLKNLRILKRLFCCLTPTSFSNIRKNIMAAIEVLENRLKEKKEEFKKERNVSFPSLLSEINPQQQHSEISQLSEYVSHLEKGQRDLYPPYQQPSNIQHNNQSNILNNNNNQQNNLQNNNQPFNPNQQQNNQFNNHQQQQQLFDSNQQNNQPFNPNQFTQQQHQPFNPQQNYTENQQQNDTQPYFPPQGYVPKMIFFLRKSL